MIFRMTAELSIEIYVEAPDHKTALAIARKATRQERENYNPGDWHVEGEPSITASQDWIDSLPYGGDGAKTVGDYLKEQVASVVEGEGC